MADYIFFVMPNPENNTETQPNNTSNSIRRTLGTSSLFGRRSSRSAATRPTSETEETKPTSPVSTTHIRIVPSIENPSRSLIFSIIERDLEVGRIIKIGRFTDKSSIKNHISFKSKVVSRAHCEIWLNHDGKVLIKDTKSSSGTFVNHVRLSPANTESRPVEIKDGDIVQLGIDYQGGYEEIYRSVKMKFEVNRPQQAQPVSYSMSAFNNLKQLTSLPPSDQHQSQMTSCHKVEVEECCICLYALAPFQALFVAPCSHSYHFKCIKPLLDSYPGFQCPICRTYSDLDASVAIEAEEVIEKYGLGHSQLQTESIVQPLNSSSEPPLSTTLVACTTSLSGIMSPLSSPSDISISEQEASQDLEDHRSMINLEEDTQHGNTQRTNRHNSNNNLVEKIKMAFTNDKRHAKSSLLVTKKQTSNSSITSASDDDILDSPSSSSPPSSPRATALQPILSRQSTHYNPLNDILEESMLATGSSRT